MPRNGTNTVRSYDVTFQSVVSLGTSLATAGEDGYVKLWSPKGVLRSTVVSLPSPILTLDWACDASHLAFSSENRIYIADLRRQREILHFPAHKGNTFYENLWLPLENSNIRDCIVLGLESNGYGLSFWRRRRTIPVIRRQRHRTLHWRCAGVECSLISLVTRWTCPRGWQPPSRPTVFPRRTGSLQSKPPPSITDMDPSA